MRISSVTLGPGAREQQTHAERSHTAGWLPQAYTRQRRLGEKVAEWFAPKADAAMAEASYEVSMELPGVAAGDFVVMMQDGSLTIQPEKRFDHTERAFQRSFRLLPDAVDRVDAAFRNALLSVRIPKLRPTTGDGRKSLAET